MVVLIVTRICTRTATREYIPARLRCSLPHTALLALAAAGWVVRSVVRLATRRRSGGGAVIIIIQDHHHGYGARGGSARRRASAAAITACGTAPAVVVAVVFRQIDCHWRPTERLGRDTGVGSGQPQAGGLAGGFGACVGGAGGRRRGRGCRALRRRPHGSAEQGHDVAGPRCSGGVLLLRARRSRGPRAPLRGGGGGGGGAGGGARPSRLL
jgi:hypothetical protein